MLTEVIREKPNKPIMLMPKLNLTNEEKEAELKKYRDLCIAAIDYLLLFMPIDGYRDLQLRVQEEYEKKRLTKLKQWFRDFTEGGQVDPKFGKFIQEKTGHAVNLRAVFEKRVEKIIARGGIKTDNQYYDVVEKINELCEVESPDKKQIDLLGSFILDYEKRKKRKG